MNWILTHSGRQFDLVNPTAAMISPLDIAHSLSNLCRFNGHTRTHYSVAQHSMLVSKLVPDQHVPASSFIDFDSGNWSPIEKPGRAASTLTRVANGRKKFGERFLMPYYGSGSGLTGRCIERPIGTITTRDRWAVVDGNKMRMLTADEVLAAQTFPSSTLRPDNHRLTVHMAGNAVPPLAAKRIIQALKEAA